MGHEERPDQRVGSVKIVLDGVDTPSAQPRDAVALVLTRLMRAKCWLSVPLAQYRPLPLRAVASDVETL
jgi:hypothetical protein